MKDHFMLAFSNLRRRGLRSWLTMIGIFIGIAAVVGLISLGQGLQGAINQQFEQLGKSTIVIQSKTIGPPGTATGSLSPYNIRLKCNKICKRGSKCCWHISKIYCSNIQTGIKGRTSSRNRPKRHFFF